MIYREDVQLIIFKNRINNSRFAITRSDVVAINKHYSDRDHFLYAPDGLFVDGLPCSWDRSSGMLYIEYENKVSLNVKDLVPAWVTVSE